MAGSGRLGDGSTAWWWGLGEASLTGGLWLTLLLEKELTFNR
jgi:hypothetical protein